MGNIRRKPGRTWQEGRAVTLTALTVRRQEDNSYSRLTERTQGGLEFGDKPINNL